MNKSELVQQRHAANVERYGQVSADAVKDASVQNEQPDLWKIRPGRITTPREGEQYAQLLADFGNYPAGMSPCMAAGLNGDAADGCPFAGTEDCTCGEA